MFVAYTGMNCITKSKFALPTYNKQCLPPEDRDLQILPVIKPLKTRQWKGENSKIET